MASSLMEIYRRIVEEEVAFTLEPQAPTDEEAVQNLIKHMLEKDPHNRATLHDVMEHPWVTLNGTVPLEPTEYKVRLLTRVLWQSNLINVCCSALIDSQSRLSRLPKRTQAVPSALWTIS